MTKTVRFTLAQLSAMPRPIGYIEELRACTFSIVGDIWTFSADDSRYKALKEKYRGYKPTDDDLRRHRERQLTARPVEKIPENFNGEWWLDSAGNAGCSCA